MIISLLNNLGVSAEKLSTLAFNCHQNITSFLGSVSRTVSLESLFERIGKLFSRIITLLNSLIYFVAKFIFQIVDFIQYLTYKIAGISLSNEITFDLPMFRLLTSDAILKIFLTMFILGVMLIIILSIIAIIKSEYNNATGGNKDGKIVNSAAKVGGKAVYSIVMMILVPFLVVAGIAFGSVFLSSVNAAVNANGSANTTIGGQLFIASSYNANRYRMYAESGQRIPILYSFDDPYKSGRYTYYSYEELQKMYEEYDSGWDDYNTATTGTYSQFASTLSYKNGKLVNNSKNYVGYENFVTTPEQYFVMADFIDYAVKNDLDFYIMDANDEQIDWDRTSSELKLTNTVYDDTTNTLKISYIDTTNITGFYSDEYTLVLSPSGFNASSPIVDSINTISELVNILLDDTKELDAEAKLFRLLERVDGSINVVKWKTEEVSFNGEMFPVYTLTKKYKNSRTGAVETRASIEVAKKEGMSDSGQTGAGNVVYYILQKDSEGNYKYTNQTIDYYNDGGTYLDELTPVYIYGSWAEKLYNDMKVIYKDINIDNFINYDTWADSLGKYFSTTDDITSENVTQFATTLIHPLGLIMSELFLGVTLEDEEDELLTDYSFASKYSKDLIQSICFAVSGEIRYMQLANEIDAFIKLFNGLFMPIMEDLQRIEGFDMDGSGEYSVQAYVYRAYLCSVLLTDSGTEYLNNLGQTIYKLTSLVNSIARGEKSVYSNESGLVYEIDYDEDKNGNLIPYVATVGSNTGKYVYNSSGEKVLTCDEKGKISSSSDAIYMPRGGKTSYVQVDDYGYYKIYLPISDGADYYSRLEAMALGVLKDWDNAFNLYFETYYKVKYDGEGDTTIYFMNGDGETKAKFTPGYYYVPRAVDGNTYYIDGKKAVYKLTVVKTGSGYYTITYDGNTYEFGEGKSTRNESQEKKEIFDKFFTEASARAYVYMPTDGDISKDNTSVKLTLAEIPDKDSGYLSAVYYEKPSDGSSWNAVYNTTSVSSSDRYSASVVGNTIKDKMEEFYLFAGSPKTSGKNNGYIYSNITVEMQKTIDDILKGCDKDAVYYNYMLSYKKSMLFIHADGSIATEALLGYDENSGTLPKVEKYDYDYAFTMADILSADTLTNSEIAEIEEQLSSLISIVDKYSDVTYGRIYKKAKSLLMGYYKNKVVNAFLNYMSAKVQAGFSVTVNGNQYTVSQAQSTRNFLEFIYGNQLLFDSLYDQLKNKTAYNNLTDFNKMAMDGLFGELNSDYRDCLTLIKDLNAKCTDYEENYKENSIFKSEKIQKSKFLETLTFTDQDFELIENVYYIIYGEKITMNYRTLANAIMGDKKNDGEVNWEDNRINIALNLFVNGFANAFQNYFTDSENFYAKLYAVKGESGDNNSYAYETLSRFIEIKKKNESLGAGIDDTYTGIIDKDGTFGYLRQFLKDFGNLCFDLETKSTFGKLSYDSLDDTSLLTNSYSTTLLSTLNDLLSEVDFGNGENVSISRFEKLTRKDNQVLTTQLLNESKFKDFSSQSKYDIYLIYDYYSAKLKEYEEIKENAEKAVSYIYKFQNGVYGLQGSSLVYSDYITNYLNYFKYNVDVSGTDFINKYIYEDYYLTVSNSYGSNDSLTDRDKTNYFFEYLNAFKDFKFGTNGTYYDSLSDLQKKVVDNTYDYYVKLKDSVLTTDFYDGYNKAKERVDSLYALIYEEKTVSESGKASSILGTIETEVKAILNLNRVLDFVGLDYDVNKTLKDYRIDALKYLTEFEEYSGETSASIQSRYLALLYIACADYTQDNAGEYIITSDNFSKQTILKLAGIENRAEEKLVNLEYEINYTNSKSDERYGSVFIICTYNDTTAMYEPFLMASKANSSGIPYSNYLCSLANDTVQYYPVIAKGIFDSSGKPTAIRKVDGNIEFYREDVYKFSLTDIIMEDYSTGQEHTSNEYSTGQTILSSFRKVFSLKGIKDAVSDIISFFKGDIQSGEYYGITSTTVYHLDGGHCNLNYTFNSSTGISMIYLYDYAELNSIVLIVASIVLLKAMMTVLFGLISSVFELGIMFAISPGVMSLHSINEKAVGKWRSKFLNSFFVMYGFIIAINAFFILIELINRIGNIMPEISVSSQHILGQTYLFRFVDLGKIIGYFATTFALLTVTTMLNSMTGMFSDDLLGFGDVLSSGSKARGAVSSQVAEAKYFSSGQQFKDAAVQVVDDGLGMVPGVRGIDSVREIRDGHKKKKNLQKAEQLYGDLLAKGLSQKQAEQARQSYLDAMNVRVDEARRRGQEEDARRRGALDSSRSYKKPKKTKTCPWCGKEYDPKKGKATNCPHCGKSVK